MAAPQQAFAARPNHPLSSLSFTHLSDENSLDEWLQYRRVEKVGNGIQRDKGDRCDLGSGIWNMVEMDGFASHSGTMATTLHNAR